jgi:hypothetical protein
MVWYIAKFAMQQTADALKFDADVTASVIF